jgi:hypothetical protein
MIAFTTKEKKPKVTALKGKDNTCKIGLRRNIIMVRDTPAIIYAPAPPVILTPERISVVKKSEEV